MFWRWEKQPNSQQIPDWSEISKKLVKGWRKSFQYGKAKFLLMEKELRSNFLDMWKEGKRVKNWCFNSKSREPVKDKYPDEASSFKLSRRWFEESRRRHRISLQRKTHAAQKSPDVLCSAIENFRARSLRERKWGLTLLKIWQTWTQSMKKLALYIYKIFTYVWITSGKSGLEKCQCTVQLTIFSDGSTLPPLQIFCGKGLRMNAAEKNSGIEDRYINSDLKISLYVRVHIKRIPWKFHILSLKNFRVIPIMFAKCLFINIQKQ